MNQAYLPISCFGKLPFWREYLEAGPAQPTSRALRQWLHRGREALGLARGDQSVGDEPFSARLHVLIGVPGSRELLVGVIRPSHDEGGRQFPFAVYTHVARKLYGRRHALFPLALVPVWEALDDAWESLFSVVNRQAFDDTLAEHQAPEPAPLSETRGDYQGRASEVAARLLGDDPDVSLDALGANMRDVVARIRESVGGRGVLLELPVAGENAEACFQSSFWIELFNAQFRLRRFEPSVLLDAVPTTASRRLFLKFGALDPEDYIGVVGGPGPTGVLCPARGLAAQARQGSTNGDGATYADLLGRLGRGV